MVSKAQIKKRYADAIAESTAKPGLIQAIYALGNDRSLKGADLVSYDGYRGQRPSGRQIAKAKQLLGIKSGIKPKEKQKIPHSDDPTVPITRGLKAIIDRAELDKRLAKKEYQQRLAGIEARAKAAKLALKALRAAAS